MIEWKHEIKQRLAELKLDPTREAEIVEELAQHLEDRYRESLAGGAAPEEAHRTALAEVRETALLSRELCQIERPVYREPIVPGAKGRNMISDIWQDARYGLRMMRKNPGFTTIAVLTLSLGIGANTAIFQLLNAVRLQSLPVKNPNELALVSIANLEGPAGNFSGWYSYLTNPQWEQIRARQEAFSDICAWGNSTFNLSVGGEDRFAENGLWVSGDFFKVLGVTPLLGRVFTAADDARGCDSPGVVLSYAFWKREFGGNASAVGTKITLNSHAFEVIGVTPSNFFGVEIGRNYDVAIPICADAMLSGEDSRLDRRWAWWLAAMGRLRPGWSVEQATLHLSTISPGLFQETLHPGWNPGTKEKYLGYQLEASPGGQGVSRLRRQYDTPLWLLLAIAGLVLLIACANLANLLLARASVRQREMAVRLALGASRGRLIRQMLVESLVLAVSGALLGAWVARYLSEYALTLISTEINPLFVALNLDWRVLGFTAGLAILTCILFGLAPALRASGTDLIAAMKTANGSLASGRERFGLRRILVVSQVALSLVLLVGALLFIRSLHNLLTLDAGFQQTGILQTDVNATRLHLAAAGRHQFRRDLLERLRAIPGVEGAASSSHVPLGGSNWNDTVYLGSSNDEQKGDSRFNRVSSDYFKTLGIPMLAGRDFSDIDTTTSSKVAVINEVFARQFLHGGSPLGQMFRVEGERGVPDVAFQIVGLVKNTIYGDLREELKPIVYVAATQDERPGQSYQFLLRSNLPLSGLMTSVRGSIDETNPEASFHFHNFQTQIRESLMRERLMATLSGFFGVLAALLAAIGLYGVISYTVARRTNEIGLRMALGAGRRTIVYLIMREAAIMLAFGLMIGAAAAMMAANTASALLYGLRPNDAVTMIMAASFLAVVAAVASYLPARRASLLDPMAALREQ